LLRATTEAEAFDSIASELAALKSSLVLLRLDEAAVALRVSHLRVEQARLEQIEAVIGRPLLGLGVPLGPGTPYAALLERREPLYSPERTAIIRATLPGISEEAVAGLLGILASLPSVTAPLLREGKAFGLLIVLGSELVPADVAAVGAFAHQLAASFIKVGLIRELEDNLRELRVTQAQLLQSQKLEAVGRLAGGVAHDFNNLLTVINGYSELLLEGLPQDDPRRKEAEEIVRAGRRAAELTGQLLAFSRRQVLRLELLDLNAVVESMRNAFLRLLGEDIELEVEPDPALPRVRADSTQLAQALLNLALNARDAMGEGGRLMIRTSVVTPDGEFLDAHPEVQGGRYACVRVEDTGTGIPEEVLPRVFEPFFTTKEPGRGTGLGLAMVYGFVKQSGGYVYAENRAEGGARLSVYLPVADGDEDLPPKAAPGGESSRPTGTEGILLVEDDLPVLAFSRGILERAGYQVTACANPAEALALDAALLERVSLLVADVMMPGMNGKVLAEELRKRRPLLRVLFVSGHVEDIFSRLGIGAGGVEFLQKPYSAPGLLLRVREILDAQPGRMG
jgi:signal transduction histidine kinase/CheY-like chemotaxis protein